VCVDGMFLAFSCYFAVDAAALESVVDVVLRQRTEGGGFNCRANRSGARVVFRALDDHDSGSSAGVGSHSGVRAASALSPTAVAKRIR